MELVPTTETPRKRKHSEYHDPDYHQQQDLQLDENKIQQKRVKMAVEKKKQTETPATTIGSDTGLSISQIQRICELIRSEFQRELSQKEQQLAEIDGRLLQARQLLDKLRYQVVSEYYRKQQVTLNAADVAKVRGTDTLFGDETSAGPQLPLHPAIKKIVGKRPLPQPTHLPERTAAVVAKQSIKLRNPANRRAERRRQQKIRQQGIVTDHSKDEETPKPKLDTDQDEQPCTSRQAFERQQQLELNASRLNNKNKFIFVVGNTSKYIGVEDGTRQQSLAYKWLVYLQGKDLPKPLEAYIKKVRFHLHHTYRPNDIVDVHKPPFQLSRRGWGEFPMRIQLYFQEKLQQKPIQMMHSIVLDKTKCGLHTMGAETVIEVWLKSEILPCLPPPPAKVLPEVTSLDDSSKPRTISITQNKEELDDNLFAGEISDINNIEELQPTVLVTETLKLSSPKKTKTPNHTSPSIIYLPVNGQKSPNKPKSEIMQILGNGQTKKKNVVFQKAGKLYIIDPQQSKLKQAVRQQSLLKPQLSLLKPTGRRWHLIQCIRHDHGYANMSGNTGDNMQQHSNQQSHQISSINIQTPAQLTPQQRLEQLFAGLQFRSMRNAIEFLLRRLPLISSEDHNHYPFMVASSNAFKEQSALRQRCFEYLRARILLQCLKKHLQLQQINASGQEIYWSVREIVSFARLHGYTPPLKMMSRREWDSAPPVDSHAQLSHRVKEQLGEDSSSNSLSFCSITTNLCVEKWLSKQLPYLESHLEDDQQVIDIETIISPPSAINSHIKRSSIQRQSLEKNQMNHNQCQYLCLPPPPHLETAAELVNEMCKDINIHLETEQPVPGVSQSLSLILLSHVLRMFVEKLVRRSVATKLQQQQQQRHHHHKELILPQAAANSDITLQPHDIARVIVQCSELDFLGNGHFGIMASLEPQT